MVATLVLGLEDNARVRKHFSKQRLTLEQFLLSIIADNLQWMSWTKTKDARHNKNKPKSILVRLTEEDKNNDIVSFKSPEEYEEYMRKLRNG